jgi:DNA-binding NtrC family response regulator
LRKLRILVVDDNQSAADALARVLSKKGDVVRAVYDGNTAIEAIQEAPPDIVLTDMKMEPVDGMEVLKAARAQRPPCEVIVFTGYGAIEVAVQAMRLGARDFLTKPVTIDQLIVRLDQVRRGPQAAVPEEPLSLSTESELSRSLWDKLRRAADVPSPVWIEGEVGSGRSHVAHLIHQLGAAGKTVTVWDPLSDGTLPTSGTVLIPNVDDLPDDAQRRLARTVSRAINAGARIMATASPNSHVARNEGTLRADLYYAIAVITVQVPPLRQRQDDILPLVREASREFARRYGRPEPELRPTQAKALQNHRWPGNVRELFNLVERAVVLGPDAFEIQVINHQEAKTRKLEDGFSLAKHLETIERGILVDALSQCAGDRTAAGKLLGVERNTLRYKLKKFGLLDQ